MSSDLYFIPMIAQALLQKDVENSLRQTFEKIKILGREPRYEKGLKQFELFMEAVNSHIEKDTSNITHDIIHELIIEVATDSFKGSDSERQKILSIIDSKLQWQNEYNKIVNEIEQLQQRSEGIGISLFFRDKLLESLIFDKCPDSKIIDKIIPGSYSIVFATGRIIWQGQLTAEELIWSKAFPGQSLKLSADTGELAEEPTKRIRLFDGEIFIRVFAGLENGKIEITLNSLRNSK